MGGERDLEEIERDLGLREKRFEDDKCVCKCLCVRGGWGEIRWGRE